MSLSHLTMTLSKLLVKQLVRVQYFPAKYSCFYLSRQSPEWKVPYKHKIMYLLVMKLFVYDQVTWTWLSCCHVNQEGHMGFVWAQDKLDLWVREWCLFCQTHTLVQPHCNINWLHTLIKFMCLIYLMLFDWKYYLRTNIHIIDVGNGQIGSGNAPLWLLFAILSNLAGQRSILFIGINKVPQWHVAVLHYFVVI